MIQQHGTSVPIPVLNAALSEIGKFPISPWNDPRMAHPEIEFNLRGDPVYQRMVSMGNMLSGKDHARAIHMPTDAEIDRYRAQRPVMSEDVKDKLREHAAKHPRNVGDEVARMLAPIEAKDRAALAKLACTFLGVQEDLIAKYKHLDNGRFRMVIGNRMRAKWKANNLYVGRKDDGTKNTGNTTGPHAPAEVQAKPAAGISEKARVVQGGAAGRAVKAAAKVARPVVRHGSDRKKKRK